MKELEPHYSTECLFLKCPPGKTIKYENKIAALHHHFFFHLMPSFFAGISPPSFLKSDSCFAALMFPPHFSFHASAGGSSHLHYFAAYSACFR